MKRYLIISISLLLMSCGDSVKKPDNLISRDNMVNIMYDLALIEATRTQIPRADQKYGEKPNQYIYRKYKIDSLQFVNSNAYYAADQKNYKKIFDEIGERIIANKKIVDSLAKANNENPAFKTPAPLVIPEQGEIK